MKLYCMYDDEFADLHQNFVDSFKDDWELTSFKIDSPSFAHDFPEHLRYGGGYQTWKYKISHIINIIKTSPVNSTFVFSDIDIVFYKSALAIVESLLAKADVVFLQEHHNMKSVWQNGNINIGFMAIRCNSNTLQFFQDVYDTMIQKIIMEQYVVNDLLYLTPNYNLNWTFFPITFFSSSIGINNLTKNIVLYHANGNSNKQTKKEYMQHIDLIVKTL